MRQKFLSMLFFSALCITGVALAEMQSDFDGTSARESNYSQIKTTHSTKKDGYIPNCDCSDYQTCCAMLPLPVNKNGHVFVEGEYLYWKTYGLFPYATKNTNVYPYGDSNDIFDSFWDTELKQSRLSPNSGYRLTLGFYLSKCWSLRSVFRQYDANGSDAFNTVPILTAGAEPPHGEQVTVVWSVIQNPGGGSLPEKVNSRQRYREKVLDVDFTRAFSCNRFTLNSFMGVRFAWIKSDLSIAYKSGEGEGGLNVSDINNRFNLGSGLHVGADGYVDLSKGFGFYGNSQLAVLIGQFKYRIRTKLKQIPRDADMTQIQKITDFQTNWSSSIGVNWAHRFKDCGYYLGFKVGYEVNIWPNFISAFLAAPDINLNGVTIDSFNSTWRRTLLTHGLTVSGRFDF